MGSMPGRQERTQQVGFGEDRNYARSICGKQSDSQKKNQNQRSPGTIQTALPTWVTLPQNFKCLPTGQGINQGGRLNQAAP